MITSMPRPSAASAYSAINAGVRCAETIRLSCGTSNTSSVWAACRIVSQSDLLPMMTATSGFASIAKVLLALRQSESGLSVVVVQADGLGDLEVGGRQPLQHADDLGLRDRAFVGG